MSQGYGTLSALLPSVGTGAPITVEDDAEFIRSRILLPVLDLEKHDEIFISYPYSGIPASAHGKYVSREYHSHPVCASST